MRPSNELEDPTPARSRKPLVFVAVVAVLAVAAVAAAYLAFFSDDAPERLTLSDQAATPTLPGSAPAPGAGAAAPTIAPASADLAGTWRVAAGSEAGYRVREKLAALPAQSDAVGRSPAVTGSVRVERTGGALTATDANFEVDPNQAGQRREPA